MRFTELLGYDLHQNDPMTLLDLIDKNSVGFEQFMLTLHERYSLPVQQWILLHKNGTNVEVEGLARLIDYKGRALVVQILRDISDKIQRERIIRRDIEMAARVQNTLLPLPKHSDFLVVTTIYNPISYIGGDLYFMDWRHNNTMLRGFLADTTGHGISTALQTASMHVLLREINELDLPLSDSIRWLNKRVCEYFGEEVFAGVLGFEFDLEIRQLRLTCAGIPKSWIATKNHRGVIKYSGMCLGIYKDESFDTHMIPIEINDSFFFMTDGISDLLENNPSLPINNFQQMIDCLQYLAKSEDCRDDATAICINIRSLPQSIIRKDGWPRLIRFNGYGDYQRFKSEIANIIAEATGKTHSLCEVAVNEALANALECRDGMSRQHKVTLRFNKIGHFFIVRVKTSRIGFAGNSLLRRLRSHPAEMFSFGADAAMGRGIPIMLSVSHKMTYNSEGTELLLAWQL